MEEQIFMNRIRDLADLCWRRNCAVFSDFLTLYEQDMAQSVAAGLNGIRMEFYGGYPEAERRLVSFAPQDQPSPEEWPIHCVMIAPRSSRFAQTVSHRDYLGALIHLGMDRSVLGDILLRGDTAYVFCLDRMSGFILDQLIQVRRNPVTARLVSEHTDLPQPVLVPVEGSVASVRLDALISFAFHESRGNAASMISGGQVFVDGRQVSRPGFEPKPGAIISVRGYGRFRFADVTGTTRKGRIYVTICRFE